MGIIVNLCRMLNLLNGVFKICSRDLYRYYLLDTIWILNWDILPKNLSIV